MKRIATVGTAVFVSAVMLIALCMPINAQTPKYPDTKKVDQTDTYFGIKVPDPYRWLEDDNSAETLQWVKEENKVTFDYLSKIPYRQQVKDRLTKLANYPKFGSPFRRGENYFFFKNDGLQNQSVLYIQKGLDGKPEVLLDPNKLSADGISRLVGFSVSKDGKYAAYAVSTGGSDWEDAYVLEIATKKKMSDTLNWLKVTGLSWQGSGFYYSRYDAPEKGKELSSKNENHKVYYHKLGASQADDELIYQDPAHPQRFNTVGLTEDERFLILTVSERGSGKKGNAVFYRDTAKGDKTFTPIVAEIGDDSFGVIENVGDKFLIQTDKGSPNGKVILYDPKNPDEKNWKDIIPEKPEPLEAVETVAGNSLFLI